jgi:hypothetical protein
VTRKQRRRRKQLVDVKIDRILETEIGSTESHSVEKSIWNGQWTCRKTDCGMNE